VEVEAHHTNTEMAQSPPPQVDAGTDVRLKVKVSCRSGCDLSGRTVEVIAQDATRAKVVALTVFKEGFNETDSFVVKAPIHLGECRWSVVFPAQEVGRVLHEGSCTPVLVTAKPHKTSMAVWDLPSPVTMNSRFKIKIGVKCSAACNLMGQKIRIYGQRGKRVGTALLGGVPWPGTSALYWAEVELQAPGTEKHHTWAVRLPAPHLELPHEDASHNFHFTTARPPEHVVTVEVVAQDTQAALDNAHVVLRAQSGPAYRGHTGEDGVAKFAVPEGEYDLYATQGDEYPTFQTTLQITDDATLRAEIPFHFEPYR